MKIFFSSNIIKIMKLLPLSLNYKNQTLPYVTKVTYSRQNIKFWEMITIFNYNYNFVRLYKRNLFVFQVNKSRLI